MTDSVGGQAAGVFWDQSRVNTVPHYIDLLAPIPGQMLKKKNVN